MTSDLLIADGRVESDSDVVEGRWHSRGGRSCVGCGWLVVVGGEGGRVCACGTCGDANFRVVFACLRVGSRCFAWIRVVLAYSRVGSRCYAWVRVVFVYLRVETRMPA